MIGTHALIQEKVQYQNLALVVTDEQHRLESNKERRWQEKECCLTFWS